MTPDEPAEFTVMTGPAADCLACSFSVEALMGAIYAARFPLCRDHLREAAGLDEVLPEPEEPRYDGPARILRPFTAERGLHRRPPSG